MVTKEQFTGKPIIKETKIARLLNKFFFYLRRLAKKWKVRKYLQTDLNFF